MKLFHGTSTKYLDSILRDGIQPRNATGIDTTDRFESGTDFLSAPNHVYLSRNSARYAISTPFADNDPGDEDLDAEAAVAHAPVLIEIDSANLDESKFRPDEDWLAILAYQMRRSKCGQADDLDTDEGFESLRQLQSEICADMNLNSHLWELCLERCGSVAHFGAIPTTAFSKVHILPLNNIQFTELALVVECNCMQLPEHAEEQMHHAVLKWMVGHALSIDDWVPNAARLSKEQRRRIMSWTKVRPTVLRPGDMLAYRDSTLVHTLGSVKLQERENACA